MASATIKPTSNTTPDPGQGGTSVNGATSTGHGATTASSSGGGDSQKTCIWSGFPAVGVSLLSATLKVDWNRSAASFNHLGGNSFFLDYSLDGGASWDFLRTDSNVSGPASGTEQVALSTAQNLTLVKVRDLVGANSDPPDGDGSITVSIPDIRIEITYIAQPQFQFSSMM